MLLKGYSTDCQCSAVHSHSFPQSGLFSKDNNPINRNLKCRSFWAVDRELCSHLRTCVGFQGCRHQCVVIWTVTVHLGNFIVLSPNLQTTYICLCFRDTRGVAQRDYIWVKRLLFLSASMHRTEGSGQDLWSVSQLGPCLQNDSDGVRVELMGKRFCAKAVVLRKSLFLIL